jgi:hypothetical protein
VKVFDLFSRKAPEPQPYLRYSAEARLYEYKENLIVCSVAGIAETESLTVLDNTVEDAQLGVVALRHLAEYVVDMGDLSSRKATDWAAFRTSGAKSIKSFERVLWHVDLAVMNSAVLVWASPRLSLHAEVSAYSSANRHLPEAVGSAIRKALAAAKVLRDQGVI